MSVPSLSLEFVSEEAARAASLLAERARMAAWPSAWRPLAAWRRCRPRTISCSRRTSTSGPLVSGTSRSLPRSATCARRGAAGGRRGARRRRRRLGRPDRPGARGDRRGCRRRHPRQCPARPAGPAGGCHPGWRTLPLDDAFAQVPRAVSSLDLVIRSLRASSWPSHRPSVARGCRRHGLGRPDHRQPRVGASARLLEEQLGDAAAAADAPAQRLW